MLQIKFNLKLFIFLTIAFVIATITGTVSHEFGHYSMAKYLGYTSSISYGYTNWEDELNSGFMETAYKKYAEEIQTGADFPEREKFEIIRKKQIGDNFWITLGGPLQTILTGTLGLVLLFFNRRNIFNSRTLLIKHWILIFISLFWLRQSANLITWCFSYIIKGHFSLNGDEIILATDLGLPIWSILSFTAIVGFLVLAVIVYKFLPVSQRITFILAGLCGGSFGYYFWLFWIGPILIP